MTQKPEVMDKGPEKSSEESVIVELINKSDLLSGGLERQHMHLFSEKTHSVIKNLQRFTDLKLTDGV